MSSRLLPFAKRMRSAPTESEARLWRHLRAHHFRGWKFKRQQPIGHYIVDFVCFANGLVIEVDGSQHGDQRRYDAERTAWLNMRGFRVLRFWNNAVLSDTHAVLDAIWLALQDVEYGRRKD